MCITAHHMTWISLGKGRGVERLNTFSCLSAIY